MKRFSALTMSTVIGVSISLHISSQISQIPIAHATSSQTTTFAFTGQEETFTVPAGVFSLDVAMSGAEGGSANTYQGGATGKGGYLSVSVSGTPGDVFKVQVGGRGESFGVGAQNSQLNAGGWPNGGDGYVAASGYWFGAGGGGSTQLIRVLNSVDTVVAVAGGAGGAGGFLWGGHGGTTGAGTYSDTTPFEITREATGGTSSAGGVGACTDDGTCNGDGSLLQGGDAITTYGGAGGGGGYYGGGSGIGNGGGAGGSSWWDATRVTATNNQTGVRSGNGILEFTYTPLQLCAPGTYSANGYAPCVNASPGYFVSISGATSQTACPAGTTSTASASLSCQPIITTSTSTSTSTTTTTVAQSVSTPTPIGSPVCEAKVRQSISRSCYLRNTKLVIPAGAKVTLKVALSSTKICQITGASIKALKKGTCSFVLTSTPKKGKAQKTTIRVKIL